MRLMLGYCVLGVMFSTCLPVWAQSSDTSMRWLPTQRAPQALVRTHFDLMADGQGPNGRVAPGSLGPEHMMVQSIAGLAAQAVNEGRLDEMVWIALESADYDKWYEAVMQRFNYADRGMLKPWELVQRYIDNGVIKGYILYRYDYTEGGPTDLHDNMDLSVNVATTLAGIYQAILISEDIEEQAKVLGLQCLQDVRDKTQTWCFEEYQDRFSRRHVLAQSPKMPHNRSFAIANRMFTYYGLEEPVPSLYAWLEPLSTVVGWNGGDEGVFVKQLCRQSHVLYPSNWAVNLAILSAETEDILPDPQFKSLNPSDIDWSDTRSAVSYVMSDGDNVQWMLGNFCLHESYWANPHHGEFPMGWGLPYACLDQSAPYTRDYLARTQPETSSVLLCAGGYYYPDLLGIDRGPEVREQVLRLHAKRLNYFMKRSGGNTLTFIVWQHDSPEALRAYKIFSEEIEPLIGMFPYQYYPYEGGAGQIHWVQRPDGEEIPAITARYSIWARLRNERAGTPAKIARLVNEDAAETAPDAPFHAWVIVHAWSHFNEAPFDADDEAENTDDERQGEANAMTPTKWSIDRIGDHVQVVTPEELVWRIRMQHNPEQTRSIIGNTPPVGLKSQVIRRQH